MKISDNITIYTGTSAQGTESVEKVEEQIGEQKRKVIFAGELNNNLLQNDILQRKKEAQEKAMKVIGDAFAGDRAIDEDLQARRARMDELAVENREMHSSIKEIEGKLEELKEIYGMDETSEEYQQRRKELSDIKNDYQKRVSANEGAILEENAIIRGTRMERLKNSPMVKAQEQAEEILSTASEEIISMVMEDTKEHIDKEAEKREEKAEKIEEEREEQEELIGLNQMKTDVQKEIQDIVDKMKLVAEDIKGAAVDSLV